tara:strand:+ start:3649 stop:3822 length:174 start_codon:yes stop_codon:yes gene_type:complete
METLKTKPLMLSVCSRIRDMDEKRNIDKKNLGKIVLKTGLAFFGLNFVKITGVLRPT